MPPLFDLSLGVPGVGRHESDRLITPPESPPSHSLGPKKMKLTSSEVELQKLTGAYRGNGDGDGILPLVQMRLTRLRKQNGSWRALAALAIIFFAILAVAVLPSLLSHKTQGPPGHHGRIGTSPLPLSTKHPVHDLHLRAYDRLDATKPPLYVAREGDAALPTNSWYQNMLLVRGEPTALQRVYTMPFVVDVVGPVPGVRLHPNTIASSSFVMQLTYLDEDGLTVGAGVDAAQHIGKKEYSYAYNVTAINDLGLTLGWESMDMSSNIIKGMPYATMQYRSISTVDDDGNTLLPTIATSLPLGSSSPIVDTDEKNRIICSESGTAEKFRVEREIQLFVEKNDFSWLVFFSKPVWVQCVTDGDEENGSAMIQVTDLVDSESADDASVNSDNVDDALVIRIALLDSCTTGKNVQFCREGLGYRWDKTPSTENYARVLRSHAGAYPGNSTSVAYTVEDGHDEATLTFDFDVRQMTPASYADVNWEEPELIMFALPHHLDRLMSGSLPKEGFYCVSTLIGPACLIGGAKWDLHESLPKTSFRAPRPPPPTYIPRLAEALVEDINYTLPDFYQRGAGDTYFSGKMLAKLARILIVAEEIDELCDDNTWEGQSQRGLYSAKCHNATRPSKKQFREGVERLRSSVEVWINGTAETPFVYDKAWGGVVSCGCLFDGKKCADTGDACPAFGDQGLNFGNAFYNDMHFHYGYFIYAAAAVAHFDPAWGREHFERVLLLVRSIANPSKTDTAFPPHRHKDWYQGSSWASGIPEPAYLNGKNQESSSEAIMSYEAVALFGRVMADAWDAVDDSANRNVAKEIYKVGQVMTATELRSTKRYWHVSHSDNAKKIYPDVYESGAIGILWSTMAQFGTWFGASPYMAYGIQLLPLTAISEQRDGLSWSNEIYYPFSQSCASDFQCTKGGWSILQLAVLATVGHVDVAVDRMKELSASAYNSAGGNGHSKTNTLWYLATRPPVPDPIPLNRFDLRGENEERPLPLYRLTDCYAPKTCTNDVLDTMVGEHTCRQRIEFLITAKGMPQWQACTSVAELEYPEACGACNPRNHDQKENEPKEEDDDGEICPPCTEEECASDLNRCPIFDRTFVCTAGPSRGGCSGGAWQIGVAQCNACCEMTKCEKFRDNEAPKIDNEDYTADKTICPPCPPSVCFGELNLCPIHEAPYLCIGGSNVGGCSSKPWDDVSNCSECCELTVDC